MREYKEVTYRALKQGQKISGATYGNMHRGFTGFVKDVTSVYVTLDLWRPGSGDIEKITSDARFLIEMTEEEIMDKYDETARKIVDAIQNKLHRDEIGSKDMWNAWISANPWELAQNCKKYKLIVVGHCTDIIPKQSLSGDLLDVGVCVEDEDGDRIWVHFRSSDIILMKKRYERRERYKKEGKGFHVDEVYQKMIDEER